MKRAGVFRAWMRRYECICIYDIYKETEEREGRRERGGGLLTTVCEYVDLRQHWGLNASALTARPGPALSVHVMLTQVTRPSAPTRCEDGHGPHVTAAMLQSDRQVTVTVKVAVAVCVCDRGGRRRKCISDSVCWPCLAPANAAVHGANAEPKSYPAFLRTPFPYRCLRIDSALIGCCSNLRIRIELKIAAAF
jgi:hypothetical protein